MKELTIDHDLLDPQFMMLPNIMLRDYTGDVLHRTFSQLTGVNVNPASVPIVHNETRDESRVHRSVALGSNSSARMWFDCHRCWRMCIA